MRKVIAFSLFMCIGSFVSQLANSSVIINPGKEILPTQKIVPNISSLKIKQLQKIAGRKLTLKEKIGFLLLKHKLKHQDKNEKMPGNTAFALALIGLGLLVAGLFIPYIILGSVVASILAIALGSSAYKQNHADKKAHTAKIIGWLTLGVIVLLTLIAVIIIATWTSLV